MSILTEISQRKLLSIICCPVCFTEFSNTSNLFCGCCEKHFDTIDDIPILIEDKYLLRSIDQIKCMKKTIRELIKSKIPIPDERLSTRYAKKTVTDILEQVNPDIEKINCA